MIITCALTVGFHGKEANPNLPEQPDQIVAQGVAAWRAGAAILHVHARNPDGSNTMDRAIYRELHQRLCAETDAIVQLTTGGSPTLPVEQRLNTCCCRPDVLAEPGAAELLHSRPAGVFQQSPRGYRALRPRDARARVKPELEAYNEAMIEEAEHLIAAGLFHPPDILNCVLHTPTQGGLRGTPRNLMGMSERLPANTLVNVSSMGRTQLPITTIALSMGLNVRVRMEDNVLLPARRAG